MKEILTFFVLAALLAVAFKIAIVLLFLAGLIFRTKETIGLIAILAAIAGFNAHPAIVIVIIIALIAASVHLRALSTHSGSYPHELK